MRGDFYPRPPRGGRRRAENVVTADTLFLSTPSARRATHPRFCCSGESGISIHALREEGDVCGSPHAGHHKGFLSTPSARRATSISMSFAKAFLHFYPRPPRGGRPKTTQGRGHRHKFLSTPSARRATSGVPFIRNPSKFLSTPSARRATGWPVCCCWRNRFLSTPSARRATPGTA